MLAFNEALAHNLGAARRRFDIIAERGLARVLRRQARRAAVQCLSERDFLFPDADEKYVPDASAYIQSYDLPAFHALLRAGSPEDAVAAFPYLSRIVKKPSPSGGCSRTGRKNW